MSHWLGVWLERRRWSQKRQANSDPRDVPTRQLPVVLPHGVQPRCGVERAATILALPNGPCRIRSHIASSGHAPFSHPKRHGLMFSSHHVTPASAYVATVSAFCAWSVPEVRPQCAISNGVSAERRSRTKATASFTRSTGIIWLKNCSRHSGNTPSQRAARRNGRLFGHTPATQIGMRGDCIGLGVKNACLSE